MGSIPVAGANKGSIAAGDTPLVDTRRANPSPPHRGGIGFAFEPKAVWKLAYKRLGEKFSPKARFPLHLRWFLPLKNRKTS